MLPQISIYSPYWGCISNKVLARKYGRYLEGYCPTNVHWINYWSDIIIQAIGIEKVLKLVEMNPGVSFQNGILLIRNTAPDMDREDDARFYDELQRQLLY